MSHFDASACLPACLLLPLLQLVAFLMMCGLMECGRRRLMTLPACLLLLWAVLRLIQTRKVGCTSCGVNEIGCELHWLYAWCMMKCARLGPMCR